MNDGLNNKIDRIDAVREQFEEKGTHIWNFRPSLLCMMTKDNLVGVEIGVLSGINAYLTLGSLDIDKLYLIDPYEGGEAKHKESAKELLSVFGNGVEWVYKYSYDAVEELKDIEFDFVYIDGMHDYESVLQDITLYYPLVKSGGIICGHDFCKGHMGVVKAVDKFFGIENVYVANRDWWTNVP